jgi:glycosyltransferase involved in cell wall biosynthesis
MRILHVAETRSDKPSGVSTYVLELVKALALEPGCAVGLLPSLPGVDPLGHSSIPNCVTFPPPSRQHYNPWRVDSGWAERIEAAFGRPDLVNFHGVYNPFHTALARQLARKGWKYVVSTHGGMQEQAQRRKRLKKSVGNRLFFNSFLRGASAIHASNLGEKEFIVRRFPAAKVFFLDNAVQADVIAELGSVREVERRGGAELTIGFLGRIDAHAKGIDLLLRAVALLEARYPALAVRFQFIGPFHTRRDEREVMNMLAQLRRPERIVFLGPLFGKKKWAALSRFDVFIHTSRAEGRPAAILEAMAFKKPCILTPGTNLQDVVEECSGGWTCAAEPEAITRVLRDVATTPLTEIARRGANAHRYVIANFRWDTVARDYLKRLSTI